MTYKQTLEYLFAQLPMYHRIGAAAYKADLKNTIDLMNVLEHPEKKFRSVHIAGTNGKGSTSHMLAAVLQEAGYKVGLYTSPHLKDFRERIKINGKMIGQKSVQQFVEKHKKDFEKIQPSFFEWTVALAFDYFAKQKIDVAVVEVGLGGRLDSTNVIMPELSVITNISFDHVNLLGNSLKKIAAEKAGIIKEGIPVVIGERDEACDEVFVEAAKNRNAAIFFASDLFKIKGNRKFVKGKLKLNYTIDKEKPGYCDLPGMYQLKNIRTVYAACTMLHSISSFKVSKTHFFKALNHASEITGLQGRWHLLQKSPMIILDSGHNEAGIAEVMLNLKHTDFDNLHFIISVVNDKDITNILRQLPKKASYYFTRSSVPRSLDENNLKAEANKFSLKGECYKTVKLAIKAAKKNAGKKDLIFVGGSTFTVADAL